MSVLPCPPEGQDGLLASKEEGAKYDAAFYSIDHYIAYWLDEDGTTKHNCTNTTLLSIQSGGTGGVDPNAQQNVACNGIGGIMQVSRPPCKHRPSERRRTATLVTDLRPIHSLARVGPAADTPFHDNALNQRRPTPSPRPFASRIGKTTTTRRAKVWGNVTPTPWP